MLCSDCNIFFRDVVRQTSEHVVVLHRLLDHLRSLSPHCQHGLKRIQLLNLGLQSIVEQISEEPLSTDLTVLVIPDEFEESDESSSSADPSAAVDQQGSVGHLDQIVLSLVLQVQQHLGVSQHLSLSPALAVQMVDMLHFTCIFRSPS